MLEVSDTFFTLATFSLAFVILALVRRNGQNKDGKRRPPSLPSVPFLGSAPFFRGGMDAMPHFFMETAETLGPLFHFYAGNKLVVVLNGKEAITNAYQKRAEVFGDRPDFWTERNINNVNLKGILFSHYHDTFKRTHKTTLSILREFGFGATKEIEHRILEEVEAMMKEIREYNGQPFYPEFTFAEATGIIMQKILFGRQAVSRMNSHALVKAGNEFVANIDPRFDSAPIIRFIPRYRKMIDAMTRAQNEINQIFEEAIKLSQSEDSELNFVKRYIEIAGLGYDRENLIYILRDLNLGASDTVSTTIQYLVLELANHPEVQTRLQREIDEVVPESRLPSLDDRPHLPYTEAVIMESMRRHTLVPIPATRLTMRDTEVCGYHIPKGCVAFCNIYSAHMDPKVWGDPTNFRPERFLDKENNVIGKETILSFSLGKRACIGETLARQEIFLLSASLVQHFDFRPPEGQRSIEWKDEVSVVVRPCHFEIRMIPRRNA